jgi:hypothetical protein
MIRNRPLTVRSAVGFALQIGAVLGAFATSFIFSVWLSRILSPKGEWLQNGLTAFGLAAAWLVLTLVYASLIANSIKWLLCLFSPKPPADDHE